MSKPFFGILLVLLGLAGIWFLVTGQLSAIIKKSATTSMTNPSPASTTPAAPAQVAAGSSTSTAALTSYAPFNLGSPLAAYGVAVGDTGAKIEPLSGYSAA